MEKVIEFLHTVNDVIYMNFWSKVFPFLQNEWCIIYALILFILSIFLIVGIITCFKRFPKFFLFLIILIAIICVASYFLIYK
jgi:hypothetical protein